MNTNNTLTKISFLFIVGVTIISFPINNGFATDFSDSFSNSNSPVLLNEISDDIYIYQEKWRRLSAFLYFQKVINQSLNQERVLTSYFNCMPKPSKQIWDSLELNVEKGEFQEMESYLQQMRANRKVVINQIETLRKKLDDVLGKTIILKADKISYGKYNIDKKSFYKFDIEFFSNNCTYAPLIIKPHIGSNSSCGTRSSCAENRPNHTETNGSNSKLLVKKIIINGKLYSKNIYLFNISQPPGFEVEIRDVPVNVELAKKWRTTSAEPSVKIEFGIWAFSDAAERCCFIGCVKRAGYPWLILYPRSVIIE